LRSSATAARCLRLPAGPRALLAWLALHPGMHPRSRVAGRLWPDVLGESARNSLRTALAALSQCANCGAT
jgi:DNA-binding SARP family transcriptional activator